MTHFHSIPRVDGLQANNNESEEATGFQDSSSAQPDYPNGNDDGVTPPSKDIPLPDEDEIFPNRDVPEEEEYLPDEKEVVIEEPPKETGEPYFPGKGDDFPIEEEEEFPQSDPEE